ncbi:YjcZ family sporulation protein [Salibacterium salarium]|uniref:YjcZ family sporulation protein n=1 Tax=Salibacterium salarium TaxID=284579 RepID=A0A3R9P3U2_9BACI|nr:YjcZ family sporulation protein [Salibacterium salarium]RSL30461.1 YjcZ family sporulation protein [Salibacterium salarium]
MYSGNGQSPNQVGGYSGGYGGYGCQVGGYGGNQVGGYSGGGYGRGKGFALIVVLFILLIIVGASKVDHHCKD